jgi:hypothetical protein
VDDEYEMDDDTEQDLKDQIAEYENNLRRILVNRGINLESLAQQIADPKGHVEVQIQMISAITGIPKRILTGSERGELSSSQDTDQWLSMIKERREEYAEPNIIRPLVDRLMKYGILPETDYQVDWEDLFAPSEKEKAEVGKERSAALKNYGSEPVLQSYVPPRVFYRLFLGLSDEQADMIEAALEEEINEERQEMQNTETEPNEEE